MNKKRSVEYGISAVKPLTVSEESFHIPGVPEKVTVSQLVRSYLCLGVVSPCETCESQCRYGREWQAAIRTGRVPEKYHKELAAHMERAARSRMKNADVMADMLRQKGVAQNDPDLIAAAMVMETLHDSNENKREKLNDVGNRMSSELARRRRQARRDLLLLSAYTGYRLYPLSMEAEVLRFVNEATGEEIATMDMEEEDHERLRAKLKPRVRKMIMRVFGGETEGAE